MPSQPNLINPLPQSLFHSWFRILGPPKLQQIQIILVNLVTNQIWSGFRTRKNEADFNIAKLKKLFFIGKQVLFQRIKSYF